MREQSGCQFQLLCKAWRLNFVFHGLLQWLVEAEKEQRKKKRAQGKNKSYVEEEEEKPKLEDIDIDFGTTENGDSAFGDRR